MKILIPTVDYPPIEGGIATAAVQLSRELAALGHEVTVVAPASGEAGQRFDDLAQFDAGEPARILRFGGYGLGWGRLLPLLGTAWPETKDTDLILAINVAYGGVLGRLARLRRRKRYVAFAYAYEFLKFRRNPFLRALLNSIYARAETTVAISEFTRENLIKFGVAEHRITVALPGAAPAKPADAGRIAKLRARLGMHGDRFLLAAGRFIPRKGHLTLVEAMPRVLESCPNVDLVLAGRGPCREDCIARAHALGIEGHLFFPGYVEDEDLAALYQACTLFALPAGEDDDGQVEGFGLVFAEAHAYGKPVVAGRAGGAPDAVHHGETGLLVPPKDRARLAKALITLLDDPAYARKLGEQGRKRVETELNWRAFTKRVLEAVQ